MKAKTKSSPFSKGKAHNVLVAARWIETICAVQQDVAPYCRLRWQVLWAWVEFFDICFKADPDFLNPSELKRLDDVTTILVHGNKVLQKVNCDARLARWKMRPKIHTMQHICDDAQSSHRNPRAWMSFKEEETMGKLAKAASAAHALTLCNRSLERWCVQFFNFMEMSPDDV